MSYLEDCAKKKNKCDCLHDCSDCLELVRDAVEEFIAWNKEVPACARLVVTGGVLALKGALARDALLRKHHCAPFLSEEEYKRISAFRASASWGRKMARQLKLTSVTLHWEAGDIDTSQHEEHMNAIREIANQFGPSRTYNMDETGLMYKCLPNRRVVELDRKIITRGSKTMNAKECITLYICTNADGLDK